MMKNNPRRFVNLVMHNWVERIYSLRRLDPYTHLFYPSTAQAEAESESESESAANKEKLPMIQLGPLPEPITSFAPVSPGGGMNLFALLAPRSSESRIVSVSTAGDTVLFDADEHLYANLPRLINRPKGRYYHHPVCLSVAHPAGDDDDDDDGDEKDSLYVMDSYPDQQHQGHCFEVLEYKRDWLYYGHRDEGYWQWQFLPPPPFLYEPGAGYRPPRITSYAAVVGADGRSSICVSYDGFRDVGTYRFDVTAARRDGGRPRRRELWSHDGEGRRHVEEWRRVGDWALPFAGGAEYVPELELWLGFSARKPNHLCAVDLSGAMDDGHGYGQAPAVQHVWEEEEEDLNWLPTPTHLALVNLGSGRFCVAKCFDGDGTGSRLGKQFAVLAGVELMRDGKSLRMVKHKCARYDCATEFIQWVL